MKTFAVCGIDTGVGKTEVTGLLARWLLGASERVITMKLVQTGGCGPSEDIVRHRQLMDVPWTSWDQAGLTCPQSFPCPASPHLAARLGGGQVQPALLDRALAQLAAAHDRVLVEGVGGLLVPLTEDLLLLDYLADRGLPILLVGSTRLGSINHTLLSLEAIRQRGLRLLGLVCNMHPPAPAAIAQDTPQLLRVWLLRLGFACPIVSAHTVDNAMTCDFTPLLPVLDEPA